MLKKAEAVMHDSKNNGTSQRDLGANLRKLSVPSGEFSEAKKQTKRKRPLPRKHLSINNDQTTTNAAAL
jgi:hypothetical protein